MTPDRATLLRRFESLLDTALAAEAPPAGLDAELLAALSAGETVPGTETDSYALWTALTALTQEIRLQGRAFQDLTRGLGEQSEKLRREAETKARKDVRKEALSAIIDIRDRLIRGRDSVKSPASPRATWRERLFGKPGLDPAREATTQAMIRGYELGLERIDQVLSDYQAREIPCLGRPFDPRRMNAIEIAETADAPPDTVVEVYLSGYEWQGELFRPAQVKVSRAKPENETP